MLGPVYFIYWRWKKCSIYWKEYYSGHANSPTMILEAVAFEDLSIGFYFLDFMAPSRTSMCCIYGYVMV
jgi:hypothetical protein